ncbi:OTU-domain-containing protein [Trichodelitschia bisporula]|uniref:Ubiquitin thioesterase OTU n=1 Tax=Trichodelitschia bisporula TaxID=703511 RepID=A0A6G1HW84_9PEZI|nr:OTU-domain-containing protein [Trichodelitschia bisporula]
MRFRVRGPSGAVVNVTIDDSATVGDLTAKIAEATSLPVFDLKSGFPPKPLDLTSFDAATLLSDTGLKLNGEQLIAAARPAAATSKPLQLARKQNKLEMDPPEVPLAGRGGRLVLRVMPDDNSCLFRAIGKCIGGDLDWMTELRSVVAQRIQADTELYNEAVLQQKPDDYCRWIQDPDSWGGAIEIGILAQHFNLEISSINVQDLRIDRFNEGQGNMRGFLVYSGIHYDTVVLAPNGAAASPDFDVTQFDPLDEVVVAGARELTKNLQEMHYFTDTAGFDIKCNQCGWTGKGEKSASQHAETSGHYDFGEVGN